MRYSAKLLFVWNPDPVTGSRQRRLCEERIVMFQARSARDAIRKAQSLGRQGQLQYESGHRLEFAGIIQCMRLESEDPGEVWWELKRRSNPSTWAERVIPPASELYVFTDQGSQGKKPANKALQPSSRASAASKRRSASRAARG